MNNLTARVLYASLDIPKQDRLTVGRPPAIELEKVWDRFIEQSQ